MSIHLAHLVNRYAGTFQGPNGIDAVFGFGARSEMRNQFADRTGMLNAWQKCFTGGQDMSVLEAYIKLAASSYSVSCPRRI